MSEAPLGEQEVAVEAKSSPAGIPAEFEVRAPGSDYAFTGLDDHTADIGMASRKIKQGEIDRLGRMGDMTGPASEHVLALDGVAIIVNPSNPVAGLSKADVARMFCAGGATDWRQMGRSSPGPIHLYARDDQSGTWDTFKHLVLDGCPLAATAKRFASSEDLSASVANDPDGIGFIGLAYVGHSRALPITECSLPYPPTIFNIKTEEYPVSRRLFLYTPAMQAPEVADFLGYSRSDRAQQVVAGNGFVNLLIDPDDAQSQTPRRIAAALHPLGSPNTVQDFLSKTEGATRLSITFRFNPNSSALDNRALDDLERLVAFMNGPQGQGHQLILLGFTDTDGDYYHNLRLSRQRAEAIRKRLAELRFRSLVDWPGSACRLQHQ